MKLLTPEEEAGHAAATNKGALVYGASSTAAWFGLHSIAMRTSTFYRQRLPPSLKAAGWIIMFAAGTVIGAENEGLKYDQSLWTGTGLMVEQEKARREATRWDQLTLSQRAIEWSKENRTAVLGAGWAAAMAGSFGYVWRDKTQTTTQKIIQARMIAQGATILLILGAGYLYSTAEPTKKHVDHSWAMVLDEEKREKDEMDAALAEHKRNSQTQKSPQ